MPKKSPSASRRDPAALQPCCIVDNILNKGLTLTGDVVLSLANVDLARGWRVRYVGCGGVCAAVRAARHAPLPRPPALRRHADVVHRLWRDAPAVLPVRFATVVGDDEAVRRELRSRDADLRSALDLVRGRAQMTLRAFRSGASRPSPAQPAASGREFLARRAAYWRGADVPAAASIEPEPSGFAWTVPPS